MTEHPLKSWLDANDIKVSDFARSIGVTPAAVYRWLAWSGQPSLSSFVTIKATTGLEITDFLPCA